MLSLFAAEVLPNDANLRIHNSAISYILTLLLQLFCGTVVRMSSGY